MAPLAVRQGRVTMNRGRGGAPIVGGILLREVENSNSAIGDHVVINANLGCGECEFCFAGKDNLCRNWHLLGETIRGT